MSDEEAEAPPFSPQAYRPRAAFDYETVKGIIAKHFKIYEADANVAGVPGHEIAAFYVQSDAGQFSLKFEEVRREIRAHDPDLMVILQYRAGEDVLLVARKPPMAHRGVGLNLILFVATIMTTTLAGSLFYAGYEQAEGLLRWFGADVTFLHWRYLALGFLSFSLPVMAILGIHELGHFFVAKRHHVHTSFPYFIPVPPIVPIGTFGAFISIKEPIPDRKALFDIGAAGPAAGFFATIPVLIIGLLLTTAVGQPLPSIPEVHAELVSPSGVAWGYGHDNAGVDAFNGTVKTRGEDIYQERVLVNSTHPGWSTGNWTWRVEPVYLKESDEATLRVTYAAGVDSDPSPGFRESEPGNFTREYQDRTLAMGAANEGVVEFTIPSDATFVLAEFQWVPPPSPVMGLGSSLLFEGFLYLFPTPDDVLIHPTGFAGWVGLLVTGFNLLPAGQLDGGHVARAVLGPYMKWASYASVIAMVALSYLFTGWLVLAVLILLLGIRHPPPLNDKTVLDGRRKFLAVLVLLMLAVSFIPVPFYQ
jgi:Zn-dependent protease